MKCTRSSVRFLSVFLLTIVLGAPSYKAPGAFIEEINPDIQPIEGVDTVVSRLSEPSLGDTQTVDTEMVALNLQSVEPIQLDADSFFDIFVDISVPEKTNEEREKKDCDDCDAIRKAIAKKKKELMELGQKADRLTNELDTVEKAITNAQGDVDEAQRQWDRFHNSDTAQEVPDGRLETSPDQMAREAYRDHLYSQWRNADISSSQYEEKLAEEMTEDMLTEWKKKGEAKLKSALEKAKKDLQNQLKKLANIETQLSKTIELIKKCDMALAKLQKALEDCLKQCMEAPVDVLTLVGDPLLLPVPDPEPEDTRGWLAKLLDIFTGPPVIDPIPHLEPEIDLGHGPIPINPEDPLLGVPGGAIGLSGDEFTVDSFFDVFFDISVPDVECPVCKKIKDEIEKKKKELQNLGSQVDSLRKDLKQVNAKLTAANKDLDKAKSDMDRFTNNDWARLEPNGRTETTADQMARAAYNEHLLSQWRADTLTSQQLEQKWKDGMTEDMLSEWKKKVKKKLQDAVNKAQKAVNDLNKQKNAIQKQIEVLLKKIAECKKQLDALLKSLEECEKLCAENDVGHILDELDLLLPDPPLVEELPEPDNKPPVKITFGDGFVIPEGESVNMGTLLRHSDQYNEDTGQLELPDGKYRIDGNGFLIPQDSAPDDIKIEIIPEGEDKKKEDKKISFLPVDPFYDPPVPGSLFSDGFESGDTTAWSNSFGVDDFEYSEDSEFVLPDGEALSVGGPGDEDEDKGFFCNWFNVGCPVEKVTLQGVIDCMGGYQRDNCESLDENGNGKIDEDFGIVVVPLQDADDNSTAGIPVLIGGSPLISESSLGQIQSCITDSGGCTDIDFEIPKNVRFPDAILTGNDFGLALQNGTQIPLSGSLGDDFMHIQGESFNPFPITGEPGDDPLFPNDFPVSDLGGRGHRDDGIDLLYFGTTDKTVDPDTTPQGGDVLQGESAGGDILIGDPGDDLLGGPGDDIIGGTGSDDPLIGGPDPLFNPNGTPVGPPPTKEQVPQQVRDLIARIVRDNPLGPCEKLIVDVRRIRIGTKVKYTVTVTRTYAAGKSCDDGDECTLNDVCDETGACVGGDRNPECDGCEDDAECDDGDLCTGTEICGENGKCEPGEEVICDDDGDECTEDFCDPSTGECVYERIDDCGSDEGICGDNELDAGEECDDGNNAEGDGCSSDCTIEPEDVSEPGECWNGKLDKGEECETDHETCDTNQYCSNCKCKNVQCPELAHPTKEDCQVVCGEGNECQPVHPIEADHGRDCFACVPKEYAECPSDMAFTSEEECKKSCGNGACGMKWVYDKQCWGCRICPTSPAWPTKDKCNDGCLNGVCKKVTDKVNELYIDCFACRDLEEEEPPKEECDPPTMELSVCENTAPCDSGVTGECVKAYTKDDGEKCYSCKPKAVEDEPSCDTGTVGDQDTCEAQCPDNGFCQADDSGCYSCTVINCPSGTFTNECPSDCDNGCDLVTSEGPVSCYSCKEPARSCEDVCADQGMIEGLDWSNYIEGELNSHSCVSGASISISTATVGDCTCSQEPSISIDSTPPVCEGTVCGDVQCGSEATCSAGENTTAVVTCNWGGWKKVDINKFVPVLGAN